MSGAVIPGVKYGCKDNRFPGPSGRSRALKFTVGEKGCCKPRFGYAIRPLSVFTLNHGPVTLHGIKNKVTIRGMFAKERFNELVSLETNTEGSDCWIVLEKSATSYFCEGRSLI